MIERHFVLSLLLSDMGKGIDGLNDFEGRKYFQKIVYFAQQASFGLDMGFGFSLHPHGPYSKELSECAKIMLAQKQECEAFGKSHNFNPEAKKGIEQLQAFARTGAGGLSELDFLEAAATLHFLWTVSLKHLPVKERTHKTIATCNVLKPQFKHEACKAIVAKLNDVGLLAA